MDAHHSATASNTVHRPPRQWPEAAPSDEIVIAGPPASFGGARQSLFYVLSPVVGSLGIFASPLVYHNRLFLYIALGMVAVTILFAVAVQWSQRREGRQSAR